MTGLDLKRAAWALRVSRNVDEAATLLGFNGGNSLRYALARAGYRIKMTRELTPIHPAQNGEEADCG